MIRNLFYAAAPGLRPFCVKQTGETSANPGRQQGGDLKGKRHSKAAGFGVGAPRYALICLLPLVLAACGSDRLAGVGGFGASEPASAPAQPSPPPVNLAGRWMLSSPGQGQCGMTFNAAAGAAEGTIAPEGGCPGKFFTSRKWTYDAFGLVIRDHTGAALARLSAAGPGFDGKASAGEPVTLMR